MNISLKTEFELNKRLAELMGLKVSGIDDSRAIGMTSSYHKLRPHTVWVSDGESAWYQFCATRSWEDVGPLVAKLQIALIPESHDGKIGTESSESWYAVVYFNGGDQYTTEVVGRPELAATIAATVAMGGSDDF